MNTKQAKDFLVQQTAEQASVENVPLSDLEKRMMYSKTLVRRLLDVLPWGF
ncbi:MAG: hypothetical protein ABSE45_10835 [Candidatus Acidiferrales bacterium]|jgi:hypothetical protein